ncbi:MAG: ComF family protein [Holosporaceae bacterium]|jgi:ComF family protein|nr:ComF family protein [Holosporaceae bacterium]
MLASLKQFILNAFDVCFPLMCCNCGEIVDSEGICPKCWKKIKWISEPKCKICGTPFEVNITEICVNCLNNRPNFDQVIAVFEYDDSSRNILLKFKHGDATYLCPQLATWIYRASKDAIQNADLLVPVPIHFFKRLKRKYNQSELLARELEKMSGITYEPRILQKSKRTPQQEGLSKNMRLQNVRGSFSVNEKYESILQQKTVVLVDDVLTTGATANECAKVLKKHGAEKVIVLVVARVTLSD